MSEDTGTRCLKTQKTTRDYRSQLWLVVLCCVRGPATVVSGVGHPGDPSITGMRTTPPVQSSRASRGMHLRIRRQRGKGEGEAGGRIHVGQLVGLACGERLGEEVALGRLGPELTEAGHLLDGLPGFRHGAA